MLVTKVDKVINCLASGVEDQNIRSVRLIRFALVDKVCVKFRLDLTAAQPPPHEA